MNVDDIRSCNALYYLLNNNAFLMTQSLGHLLSLELEENHMLSNCFLLKFAHAPVWLHVTTSLSTLVIFISINIIYTFFLQSLNNNLGHQTTQVWITACNMPSIVYNSTCIKFIFPEGRCKQCVGCKAEDCGQCIYGLDKKFGRPGKKRKVALNDSALVCQRYTLNSITIIVALCVGVSKAPLVLYFP